MGACCSKNTTTTPEPATQQSDIKPNPQQPQNTNNDQPLFKKEIFVIKHRISHEIVRHPDEDDTSSLNPSSTPGECRCRNAGVARVKTSSCSKEQLDSILLQCGKLSRSNSAGSQNPNRRRRYSRSKRSFDFDLDASLQNDDADDENDEASNHHHDHRHRRQEARVSSPSSQERDPPQHRSSSSERGRRSGSGRRISISPSRRSESPFRNLNTAASSSSSNKPAKMVPVPATDKSSNCSGEQPVTNTVKRIHVKRNVSPARTNLRIFTDNPSQEQIDKVEADTDPLRYRRKSLAEIDNNAARTSQSGNPKMAVMVPPRTRRLSRDLDMDTETIPDPSPPSYASLLLEDIHNFHQKNSNGGGGTTAAPAFELPACVTKACSIMEAVADLNSREANSADPVSQLAGFRRGLQDDRRRVGIGRGYPVPNSKTVVS